MNGYARDEVLIVGAGMGGLAAAISLHDAGIPVRVFESVSELRPLGVGINLLPHAVRELDELGLLPVLRAAGVACSELSYFSKHGRPIWGEPRGLAAGYRWPQISLHRGTLQMTLLAAAQQRLGPERLQLGHHLSQLETTDGGVRAQFVDRVSGAPLASVDGRMLIAADGIHSVVRRAFYPNEGAPRWNGAVMWRGVATAAPVLDGHTMIMLGHTRQKFVCYPIAHDTPSPGQQGQHAINFIAELRYDTTELTEREDWSKPGKLEDFLPQFEDWRFDWLDVPAMIKSAPAVWTYPMVDRDPLPRWTHGRVTLLGDAAHPMYPIGSNGASQAILDARVLTACLLRHGADTERALHHYESIRRPATSAIVLANRSQGPEIVMQLVEERAPNGFTNLRDVVQEAELVAVADKYKQLAGFAVNELNTRGSLADPNTLPPEPKP